MPPKRKSKKKSLISSSSNTAAQKAGQGSKSSRKTKEGFKEELSGSQVIQRFEKLCSEEKFDEAKKYLNSLRNIQRWQYLNLQSVIEFKTGNLRKAEAVLREADREPNSSFAVRKNLWRQFVNTCRYHALGTSFDKIIFAHMCCQKKNTIM